MSKIIDVLKINVKEVWCKPFGHKQGKQYGVAGSHSDKRFKNRSNEKTKFREGAED